MTPTPRGRLEAADNLLDPKWRLSYLTSTACGILKEFAGSAAQTLQLQCENSLIAGVSPTVGAGRPHDSRRDGGGTKT